VLGEELALGLVLGELGLELGEADDAGDALAQGLGELVRGDEVLVGALGVGRDETDGGRLVLVEGVRQADLAGLQARLVDDVALGRQRQPDGRLLGGLLAALVVEEVALGRLLGLLLGCLLDVCDERLGGFQGLGMIFRG
jgi:hypothetical protein